MEFKVGDIVQLRSGGPVSVPVAHLRAGWFMENAASDVEAARSGIIPSFLQPLDHVIPMVGTIDIGRTAPQLLRDTWSGARLVELEGPRRYSARDIGTAFAAALGGGVRIDPVPLHRGHDLWLATLKWVSEGK
jgi:uncharacterized protein YbjT (DUF2867 family)